ncbi:transport protein sec61 subunit gamma [Anaeramoeba ignava]|uniref:Transport protein sec61 subunit gamma n=1 Tax=Anaeramoeba ignava TaxID=1746090 RepID=A0A9Q0LFH5_ANAIG|nr:transport protein sec61 subunit gamma [Anaeramoeba ignava]
MEEFIVNEIIAPLRKFFKQSYQFLVRCTKPDKKEFSKTALATLIGFAIMGTIGFVIKLIFMVINNILIGSG